MGADLEPHGNCNPLTEIMNSGWIAGSSSLDPPSTHFRVTPSRRDPIPVLDRHAADSQFRRLDVRPVSPAAGTDVPGPPGAGLLRDGRESTIAPFRASAGDPNCWAAKGFNPAGRTRCRTRLDRSVFSGRPRVKRSPWPTSRS